MSDQLANQVAQLKKWVQFGHGKSGGKSGGKSEAIKTILKESGMKRTVKTESAAGSRVAQTYVWTDDKEFTSIGALIDHIAVKKPRMISEMYEAVAADNHDEEGSPSTEQKPGGHTPLGAAADDKQEKSKQQRSAKRSAEQKTGGHTPLGAAANGTQMGPPERKRQRSAKEPAEQKAGGHTPLDAAADGTKEKKTRSTPATATKPKSDDNPSARLFHYYSSGRFEAQLQARDTAIENSLKGLDAEELDIGPLKKLLKHPMLHADVHTQASKLVNEIDEAEEATAAEALDQMQRPKAVEQLKKELELKGRFLEQAKEAGLQDTISSLEEEVAELGAEIQRREERLRKHAEFDARGLAAAVRTLLEDEQKLQARRSRFAAQLKDGVDLAKELMESEEQAAE